MAIMGSSDRQSRTCLNEINVTPLVDVMLVLLIIFMVTAPMMQQSLRVSLPETAGAGASIEEDAFVLVISRTRKLTAGTATLQIDTLREKIKAIFASRRNKEIYIQADRNVDYGFVAETMAEIRAAGITQMSLVTLPKGQ